MAALLPRFKTQPLLRAQFRSRSQRARGFQSLPRAVQLCGIRARRSRQVPARPSPRERPENHIGDTDEDRSKLYENCLIFLYRLLFILYAEGRSLLPVEPRSRKFYKELSLVRLINPLRNFSEYDSRTRTRLYEDIRELCHLINGTEEKKNVEYKVPQYNGGLFDPNRHPDLEQWRVADCVLADVLRGLMFNPVPERGQAALPVETVDFGDLRVQQLGSI